MNNGKEKKNKKMIIIILLFITLLGLGGFGIYTMSTGSNNNQPKESYVRIEGEAKSRVAKFAFNLNGAKASKINQTIDIEDLFDFTYNNGTVFGLNEEKVMAPGTSGYMELVFENIGEVSIIPKWNIKEINEDKVPLKYQFSSSIEPDEEKWVDIKDLKYIEKPLNKNGKQNYFLHWKWETKSDYNDTDLGVKGTAIIGVKIDCTVSQYISK